MKCSIIILVLRYNNHKLFRSRFVRRTYILPSIVYITLHLRGSGFSGSSEMQFGGMIALTLWLSVHLDDGFICFFRIHRVGWAL